MSNVRRDRDARLAVVAGTGRRSAVIRPEGVWSARVRTAFGPVTPGGSWFVLSKGAIGLLDVTDYLLDATGPADLLATTWTIGAREIGRAWDLVRDPRVRSLRLLLDASFGRRQPAYLAALRARFGPDVVRPVVCHAKLVIVRNATWGLVVASSANLNENKRLEFFRVDDDPALADQLLAILGEWFDGPLEDGWQKSPQAHRAAFDAWRPGHVEAKEARRSGARVEALSGPGSPEDAAYFQDGPWSVDLRRAGLAYVR